MRVRRLYSILLISLLLLNFGGLFLYFPLQLFRIHREMRIALRNLPDSQLEVLRFSKVNFSKARIDDDEVVLNGNMYDIARISLKKDSVLVFALHDKAEDNLLDFLDEIIKRPLREKELPPEQIYKFITLSFLGSNQEEFNGSFSIVNSASNTLYLVPGSLFFQAIASPPPRTKS